MALPQLRGPTVHSGQSHPVGLSQKAQHEEVPPRCPDEEPPPERLQGPLECPESRRGEQLLKRALLEDCLH